MIRVVAEDHQHLRRRGARSGRLEQYGDGVGLLLAQRERAAARDGERRREISDYDLQGELALVFDLELFLLGRVDLHLAETEAARDAQGSDWRRSLGWRHRLSRAGSGSRS